MRVSATQEMQNSSISATIQSRSKYLTLSDFYHKMQRYIHKICLFKYLSIQVLTFPITMQCNVFCTLASCDMRMHDQVACECSTNEVPEMVPNAPEGYPAQVVLLTECTCDAVRIPGFEHCREMWHTRAVRTKSKLIQPEVSLPLVLLPPDGGLDPVALEPGTLSQGP